MPKRSALTPSELNPVSVYEKPLNVDYRGMAPEVGLEPTIGRLTAGSSKVERLYFQRFNWSRKADLE